MTHRSRPPWALVALLTLAPSSPAADEPTESGPAPYLAVDFTAARRLDAARDYLRQSAWLQGLGNLQAFLDREEEVLVPSRDPASGAVTWSGATTTADRLLAALPPAGRASYEALYGPQARELLAGAVRRNDPVALEAVARRFGHTTAGAEATRQLAWHELHRGRVRAAAGLFARLLARADGERLPPDAWFGAALAARQAGDQTLFRAAIQRLKSAAPREVGVAGTTVGRDDWEQTLARLRPFDEPQPAGFLPKAEPSWSGSPATEPTAVEWLRKSTQAEDLAAGPALSGSVPLVVGGRVLVRTARGVEARDTTTGRVLWEAESEWSLERLAQDLALHPYAASWVSGYLAYNPFAIHENRVLGSLSADGSRAYAVEDLGLPPFPSGKVGSRRRWDRLPPAPLPTELNDPAHHNRLLALDLQTGLLQWEAGGRGPEAGPLADAYFLGPPLALEGRLYVIVEKSPQLRLYCLDATHGRPLWSQGLVVPPERLLTDVGRRLHALRPVFADGLLLCPTAAGVLIAVDPVLRGVVWAYPYREEMPTDTAEMRNRNRPRYLPRQRLDWHAGGVMVQGGRVLLTAPESAHLHCLDLATGTVRWKVPRSEADLYLAAARGEVAVVAGRRGLRALRLADGEPAWAIETAPVVGLGAAAGKAYYLPVGGVAEGKPALVAVDLATGALLGRAEVGEGLGNLVFADGGLVSQSVFGVGMYASRATMR